MARRGVSQCDQMRAYFKSLKRREFCIDDVVDATGVCRDSVYAFIQRLKKEGVLVSRPTGHGVVYRQVKREAKKILGARKGVRRKVTNEVERLVAYMNDRAGLWVTIAQIMADTGIYSQAVCAFVLNYQKYGDLERRGPRMRYEYRAIRKVVSKYTSNAELCEAMWSVIRKLRKQFSSGDILMELRGRGKVYKLNSIRRLLNHWATEGHLIKPFLDQYRRKPRARKRPLASRGSMTVDKAA